MMARIRTVKPEFWSSEQVMSCRPLARLLFIGLWNFCDDGGNHPLAPRTIKALVFPGDAIDADEISALLDELEAAQLTQSYVADGKRYLHVRGWRHQKIEKKNFKYPPPMPEVDERSPSDPALLAECSATDRRPAARGWDEERRGEHNTHRATVEADAVPDAVASRMRLDWAPDPTLLKAYALRMAIPVEHFTRQTTAAFVCHYSATERVETQAAWVSLLVKWVKRDRAAASNIRAFPLKRPPAGPDFDDTSWASDLGAL